MPSAVQSRVLGTTDMDQLKILRARAYEVTDPADLFAPE